MKIRWTAKALDDLDRVRSFLERVDPDAAAHAVVTLARAPDRLVAYPRLGAAVEGYEPRDVRKIFVGKYEMRYEVTESHIMILRLWHGREERR